MLQDTVLWTLAGLAVIAVAIAYIDPRSRPYARRYGWGLVVLAAGLAGYALLRRRPGRRTEDVAIAGGKQLAAENLTAIDTVVESALEEQAKADLELVRRRVEEEQKRAVLDAEVTAVENVSDSLERRKALIALAKKYQDRS